jgi:hypothetical protein
MKLRVVKGVGAGEDIGEEIIVILVIIQTPK